MQQMSSTTAIGSTNRTTNHTEAPGCRGVVAVIKPSGLEVLNDNLHGECNSRGDRAENGSKDPMHLLRVARSIQQKLPGAIIHRKVNWHMRHANLVDGIWELADVQTIYNLTAV